MSNFRRRVTGITVGLGAAALLSLGHGPVAEPAASPARSGGDAAPAVDQTAIDQAAIDQAASGILEVGARRGVASPAIASRDLPPVASHASDLPDTALFAYQRAAQVMTSVRSACHLDWGLLAALGQIESDHGRSGGATLLPDGTSSPSIRGLVHPRAARLADTDQGRLDGDRTADRAVGPMQFLPSTWLSAQVDGDGDGVRSADDIDDAALAAAVYLCAWGDDVSTARGLDHAVGRYNRSPGYVSAAAELARGYRAGSYGFVATSTGPTSPTSAPPPPTRTATASGPVPAPAPTPRTATPDRTPVATGEPAPGPTPSPSQEPSPDPLPTPAPASPAPATPAPAVRIATGTLAECAQTVFCLDDQPLALGSLDTSSEDYDGDGSIESRREELLGLVGTGVGLRVERGSEPLVVHAVNGSTW